MDIKKEHHFVWAEYLRKWSNNNRDIYWITPKGKVDHHSVKDLAKERHFYRSKPLSKREIEIVKCFLEGSHEFTREVGEEILSTYMQVQAREELARVLRIESPDALRALEVMNSRFIEDRHTLHEQFARPVLTRLADGDHTALKSDDMSSFLIYLGHQVARTRLFREQWRVVSSQEKDWAEDLQSCWWLLGYITGINLGANLCEQRNNLAFCLLENDHAVNFVTSDSPVIQIRDAREVEKGAPSELGDLFFPISPNFAFVASDTKTFTPGLTKVDEAFVSSLNQKIANRAEKTVFGLTPQDVAPFRGSVGAGISNSKRE